MEAPAEAKLYLTRVFHIHAKEEFHKEKKWNEEKKTQLQFS